MYLYSIDWNNLIFSKYSRCAINLIGKDTSVTTTYQVVFSSSLLLYLIPIFIKKWICVRVCLSALQILKIISIAIVGTSDGKVNLSHMTIKFW